MDITNANTNDITITIYPFSNLTNGMLTINYYSSVYSSNIEVSTVSDGIIQCKCWSWFK